MVFASLRGGDTTVHTGSHDGNDPTALTKTDYTHREDKGVDRDRSQRKEEARHPQWDVSEIQLIIGLRAREVSWLAIQARHFLSWSSRGLCKRFHQLKDRVPWKAEYEAVLRMEESEQIAYIDRAESAVSRRRNQQSPEGQGHRVAEAVARHETIWDEAAKDEAVRGGIDVEDGVDESAHEMSGLSVMKKGRVDSHRIKRTRHAWDDYEIELLVALRARGVIYKMVLEHDFPDWSVMGIRGKLMKARETERWETRFQTIQRMDETQQLATIASAREAVARSRRRRAQAEQTGEVKAEGEDEDEDKDADDGAAGEAVTDKHSETTSREVVNESSEDELSGPGPTGVDGYEVPESPDPEMARTAPAKINVTRGSR